MLSPDAPAAFAELASAIATTDAPSRALEDVGGIEGLIATMLPAMLVIAIFIGMALWMLGRRLARPACAVSGLVLGALGGLLLAELLREQGSFVIPLVIGAGIAGGLLAALLFRLWMALSGALVLALVVPAAMVVWQGAPPLPEDAPESDQEPAAERAPDEPGDAPVRDPVIDWLERVMGVEFEQLEELPEKLAHESDDVDDANGDDPALLRETAAEQLGAAVDRGRDRARGWYEQNRDRMAAWWNALSPSAKRGLAIGAAIGALLGLTLGLALPYTAAAVQSALAGAILMFVPSRMLVERYAPDWTGLLPQSPRTVVMWLALLTLLGVILQWSLFHKRAGK